MPAYNFKSRFVLDIFHRRKLCTIRPRRKRPTVVGDKLYLYTGMRTKNCSLIREVTCTKVSAVEIAPQGVRLNGKLINRDRIRKLALADGFEGVNDFFQFFYNTYHLAPDNHLNNMELIEWK